MNEQVEKKISVPKIRLKRFKEISTEDYNLSIDPEINLIDNTIMEIAQHPEQAKELFNLIADSISVEKLMRKTGIDLKKEKELSEERNKEVLELFKKQIEIYEELAKVISDLNNNIEIIEIFNNKFQEMKKDSKKLKKKKKEKRDPFDVIVPENFWESILEDEDVLSDK